MNPNTKTLLIKGAALTSAGALGGLAANQLGISPVPAPQPGQHIIVDVPRAPVPTIERPDGTTVTIKLPGSATPNSVPEVTNTPEPSATPTATPNTTPIPTATPDSGEDGGEGPDPSPTASPQPSATPDNNGDYPDPTATATASPTLTPNPTASSTPVATETATPEPTVDPGVEKWNEAADEFINDEFFDLDPETPHPGIKGMVEFVTGKGSYFAEDPAAEYLPDLEAVLFAWHSTESGPDVPRNDKVIVHFVPVDQLDATVRAYSNGKGSGVPQIVNIGGPITTKVDPKTGEELFAGKNGNVFGRFITGTDSPQSTGYKLRIFDDELLIGGVGVEIPPPQSQPTPTAPSQVTPPPAPTPPQG